MGEDSHGRAARQPLNPPYDILSIITQEANEMDPQQHVALAKSLNDRASEPVCVNPLEYPPSKPNQCHANVEQYVGTHSGCQPVRGWLVEKFEGFTYFNAHSVVRLTDGSLADVTSSDNGSINSV